MKAHIRTLLAGMTFAAVVSTFGQPVITVQPQSQSVEVGANFVLQVTATGTAPLRYQWRLNDADIPGKTNTALVFSPIRLADAGDYTVVVTNAAGSITSQVARLDVHGPGADINFEGKQTAPIRLSPDGTRLFAVNTPDARLSVFDVSNPSNPVLMAEIPVGLEPVSVNPLSNDEAWVVNEVSDSVSIVSVSRGVVTDTIYVKDEPADVVFAEDQAFVTSARRNEVHVFDVTNRARLAVIPVLGHNPRALAVSPDGTKVYAAFALSGNRTTIVPAEHAPPQSPPVNITNPPPQVSLIVDATDTNWSHVIQFTMPDNDVVEIDAQTLGVTRYFSRIGTVNLGLAVNPFNGDLFVANTDARNLVHFEPNVRAFAYFNRITRIDAVSGAITAFNLNPGIDHTILPNPSAKATALAQPTAAVFDAGGAFLYVAAFGTDRIARVDTNGNVLARIEVGPSIGSAVNPRTVRGPRGLALNAAAQRLYVLNRIANTLSVIDTASDTVVREIPVGSFDPTPQSIRQGRGFLYDAKLSGNGSMSCASCHVDAEMDMLAWDLGNPFGTMESVTVSDRNGNNVVRTRHPMKGPMTTQTLRGLKGLDPLHWRGDRTNILHFNIAFPALMGDALLSSADMTAYRDFINTIVFQPNPNRNLDRTLPSAFAGTSPTTGSNNYVNFIYTDALGFPAQCRACHTQTGRGQFPIGFGSDRTITEDAILTRDRQHVKTAHFRNLYQKVHFTNTPGAISIAGFGFNHDGRDATILEHVSQPRFKFLTNNTAAKLSLMSFLLCFDTGTAPAVGYSRTVTAANVDTASISNDWTLLERQASLRFQDAFILAGSVTNISLIAQGTIDGQRRSMLYVAASNHYRSGKSGIGPFTRVQLVAKIQAGDTLTVMGVPSKSGARMALDRDSDGMLDGDFQAPGLRIVRAASDVIVAWPANATGFVLETATDLSPSAWSTETSLRQFVGSEIQITNALSGGTRFYRLRGL